MRWTYLAIIFSIISSSIVTLSSDRASSEVTRRDIDQIVGPNVTVIFDEDVFAETFDPLGDPVEAFTITGSIFCILPTVAPTDLECTVSPFAYTYFWTVEQVPDMIFTKDNHEKRFSYEVKPGVEQMNVHSDHVFTMEGTWEYDMGRGNGDIDPEICLMSITAYGRVEMDLPDPDRTDDLRVGRYHTIGIEVSNLGNSYAVITLEIISTPEWLEIDRMSTTRNVSAGVVDTWIITVFQEQAGSREGEVEVRLWSSIPGGGNVTEGSFYISTYDGSSRYSILVPITLTAISGLLLAIGIGVIVHRKKKA